MWKQLSFAFSFLTIIRLPFSSSEPTQDHEPASSFICFPLVGAFLGILLALTAFLLHGVMPPLVLAVLLTALLALMTRGLHLDGLADLADGIGGGYTVERRLAIMKDSHIGAFGTIALILFLSMKMAAIHTLVLQEVWAPLLLAPALSRLAIVLTAYGMPYARAEGGLGRSFLQSMTRSHPAGAIFLCALWCLPISVHFTIGLTVAVLLCVMLVRRLSRRTLHGITGDVLGAVNEITETMTLVLAASIC